MHSMYFIIIHQCYFKFYEKCLFFLFCGWLLLPVLSILHPERVTPSMTPPCKVQPMKAMVTRFTVRQVMTPLGVVQVVKAKVQQITLREFLPTLGITEEDVRNWSPVVTVPNIAVEFFIAYRFGHDLIGDRIGSFKVNEIFNGEKFFGIDSAAGSGDPDKANADYERLYQQARTSLCANLDGKFADSLRNTLFGPFGEDLATRNMWRSMEVGMKPYDDLAECYGVPATRTVCLCPCLSVRCESSCHDWC